jgi:segregation and condensation protein B
MQNELENKIEAILFYSGEPVSFKDLAKTLEVSVEEVSVSVENLRTNLQNRGVSVVIHDNTATLATASGYSDLIQKMIKEERERDLGKAGIETLSIIAYKGPVSKKEIEYIRGVNSQYALRSLLLRGLVEKKSVEGDDRMVGYIITTDALMYLGLTKVEDLPEYADIQKKLEVVEEEAENTENNE